MIKPAATEKMDTLPDQLIVEMLSYLSDRDLSRASRTCHRLRRISLADISPVIEEDLAERGDLPRLATGRRLANPTKVLRIAIQHGHYFLARLAIYQGATVTPRALEDVGASGRLDFLRLCLFKGPWGYECIMRGAGLNGRVEMIEELTKQIQQEWKEALSINRISPFFNSSRCMGENPDLVPSAHLGGGAAFCSFPSDNGYTLVALDRAFNSCLEGICEGGFIDIAKGWPSVVIAAKVSMLFAAACRGNQMKIIEWLIESFGASPDFGLVPAARADHADLVDWLIGKGATSISAALEAAVEEGNVALCKRLLSRDSSRLDDAIRIAIRYDQSEIVRVALDFLPSSASTSINRCFALAAIYSSTNTMGVLLERGAEPTSFALSRACEADDPALMASIIERGMALPVGKGKDELRRTSIRCASAAATLVTEEDCANKADEDTVGKSRITPDGINGRLTIAIHCHSFSMADHLASFPLADLDSALVEAAIAGDIPIIDSLIDKGANITPEALEAALTHHGEEFLLTLIQGYGSRFGETGRRTILSSLALMRNRPLSVGLTVSPPIEPPTKRPRLGDS